jgi:long-chain acyl-CoA synthetase
MQQTAASYEHSKWHFTSGKEGNSMKTLQYDKAAYPVFSYQTFPAFLAGIEKNYGDRPALSYFTRKQQEIKYTYRELISRVRSVREALFQRALAGKRIALVSENCVDWLTVFLAAVCCGSAVLCVDTEQSDEGIRDMIQRGDVSAVFLSPSFVPICMPEHSEAVCKQLIVINADAGMNGLAALPEFIELGSSHLAAGENSAADIAVDPNQTAEIVFTSGTTIKSKMVMLSQQGVLQNMCDTGPYVHLEPVVFTALPFYHAYGLNCAVLCSFLQGCHVYINGDLKTAFRDLKLAQPGSLFAVPLMMETIHNQFWLTVERAGKADALRRLLKVSRIGRKVGLALGQGTLNDIRQKAVGTLKTVICGGAHLNQTIIEEFDLLGVQILQGYGITECAPLVSVNCNYANKIGSVGRPMPSVQVRIESGEVWVKGISVMQGYFQEPEHTAEAMEDGWFKTGDLGVLDKDGYLYLTGRKKNLIVFKNGKKISPERLESLLSTIPLIKEVVVYGTANGTSLDDVKLTASIFPDPERTVGMTSYEVLNLLQKDIDKLNEQLPAYQQIHMVTIREKEFSKTGTRKIKRGEL